MPLAPSPSPAQSQRVAMQHRWRTIEERRREKVEPLVFCAVWVPRLYGIQPGHNGYKTRCVELLSNATCRTEGSIRSVWGKDFDRMPEEMKITLNMIDMLWRSAFSC